MKDPYPAQGQFLLPVSCINKTNLEFTFFLFLCCALTDLLCIHEAIHIFLGFELSRCFTLYG